MSTKPFRDLFGMEQYSYIFFRIHLSFHAIFRVKNDKTKIRYDFSCEKREDENTDICITHRYTRRRRPVYLTYYMDYLDYLHQVHVYTEVGGFGVSHVWFQCCEKGYFRIWKNAQNTTGTYFYVYTAVYVLTYDMSVLTHTYQVPGILLLLLTYAIDY